MLIVPAARAEQPLQWHHRADITFGVFEAAGSQRAGKMFVVTGGLMQSGAAGDWVQLYDVEADTWRATMQMSQPRAMHAQVWLGDGRILVAGGKTGRVTDGLRALASAELIDFVARQSTPVADLPFDMPTATGHLLPDGRALIVGGRSAAVFDPTTDTWAAFINLRQSRQGHASLLLDDGRVIVAGGAGRRSIEVIDPVEGFSQLQAAELPEPLDDLAIAPLAGAAQRVLILGGQNTRSGDTTDATWIVDLSDPRKTTIEPGPNLGIDGGVADHCVVTVGPFIVVVGGETQRRGADTELTAARIIDRRTLEVYSLPDCATAHDDALAFAAGDRVWVVGGFYQRSGLLRSMPLPVATRAVETLRLPEQRLIESR